MNLKYLLKTLEFLVSELFNPNIELNKQLKILILISYFSVDFDVFDNPKTRLVQNLLPSLLLLIEKEDDTDFIELSLFYLIIIGIGVSNCSPSLFNSIIENFTSTIATPSLLHYIKGLILREESKKAENKENKTLILDEALECLKLVATRLKSGKEIHRISHSFCNELEVEVLRNIGTLYKDKWKISKNDEQLKKEKDTYFENANEKAVKNNTKLRYYSLFSDGLFRSS